MTFVQATEITARFDPKVGKQSKDFLVQRVVLYQSTINIEGRHMAQASLVPKRQ